MQNKQPFLIPLGDLKVGEYFQTSGLAMKVITEHRVYINLPDNEGWITVAMDITTKRDMSFSSSQMVIRYTPTELEKIEMIPFLV